MPVRWLLACVRHNEGDKAHSGNNITATRLLTCPREVAIMDNLSIRLDPIKLNSGTFGHAVQAFADKYAEPGDITTIRFPLEGQEPFKLFGVPVSGEVDYISPDVMVIEDMKVHSESAQMMKILGGEGFRKPLGDDDYRAQLSIYAKAVRHCVAGANPTKLRIFDGAMVSSNRMLWKQVKSQAWYDREFPEMSEQELANFRPKDGDATVLEHVHDYVKFLETFEYYESNTSIQNIAGPRDMALRDMIKCMPLRGRTQMNGKKCPSYCLAREECDSIEGIT